MSLFNSMLLLVLLLFMSLVFIRLFFTMLVTRHEIPEIKASDNNISTHRLEKLLADLRLYLKLDDFEIVMRDDGDFVSLFHNINWKTKTIYLSKWIMPSVGYEIDNIIASVWMASKRIHKARSYRFLHFLLLILPMIGRILFYASFIIEVVFFILAKADYAGLIVENEAVYFMYTHALFSIVALVGFVIMMFAFFYANTNKTSLEYAYESEVATFINEMCHEYVTDLKAARVYALEFKWLVVPILKVSKKTASYKYMGPFVHFA